MLAPEHSRAGIMEALRKRHHYGTTGCRMVLDARVHFDNPAELFAEDPNLGDTTSDLVSEAMMGDILRSDDGEVTFRIDVHASSPIERIDVRSNVHIDHLMRDMRRISMSILHQRRQGVLPLVNTSQDNFLGIVVRFGRRIRKKRLVMKQRFIRTLFAFGRHF